MGFNNGKVYRGTYIYIHECVIILSRQGFKEYPLNKEELHNVELAGIIMGYVACQKTS